jgi:hypothetical protein
MYINLPTLTSFAAILSIIPAAPMPGEGIRNVEARSPAPQTVDTIKYAPEDLNTYTSADKDSYFAIDAKASYILDGVDYAIHGNIPKRQEEPIDEVYPTHIDAHAYFPSSIPIDRYVANIMK